MARQISIQNDSISAEDASQLSINVNNGSSSASLVAKPDGTLQYAGKNLVKSVNGANADASGNVSISVSSGVKLPFYTSEHTVNLTNTGSTITINKNIIVKSYSTEIYQNRSFTFPNGKVINISNLYTICAGSFIPKGTVWKVVKGRDELTGYEVLAMLELN